MSWLPYFSRFTDVGTMYLHKQFEDVHCYSPEWLPPGFPFKFWFEKIDSQNVWMKWTLKSIRPSAFIGEYSWKPSELLKINTIRGKKRLQCCFEHVIQLYWHQLCVHLGFTRFSWTRRTHWTSRSERRAWSSWSSWRKRTTWSKGELLSNKCLCNFYSHSSVFLTRKTTENIDHFCLSGRTWAARGQRSFGKQRNGGGHRWPRQERWRWTQRTTSKC